MARITVTATAEQVEQALAQLPRILAGQASDPAGVARGLQLRLGVALLSQVQQAFVTKSRGGVGSDGIRWRPLAPATIARRRITQAERQAVGLTRANNRRGLLNAAQDRLWRHIFATTLYRLRDAGVPEGQARARAGQAAWGVLKDSGAPTRLALFGGRNVDILRDTGELLRSFSPGVDDRPSGADGQVFEVPPGRVIVGTNKKVWHHRGGAHLPARPYWPDRIPPPWWAAIHVALRRGLVRAIGALLAHQFGGKP